jgi:hypothetical protein
MGLATPGPDLARFAWLPEIPADGTYRVLVCWVEDDLHATNASYTVSVDGHALLSIVLSQQERGDTWVELGRVPLQAGQHVQIELTNDADGIVVADAVRIVLVEPAGG